MNQTTLDALQCLHEKLEKDHRELQNALNKQKSLYRDVENQCRITKDKLETALEENEKRESQLEVEFKSKFENLRAELKVRKGWMIKERRFV